jgi:TonB family protein
VIHVAVDADGHVLEAETIEAPSQVLGDAALAFAKSYQFSPAYRGKVPLQRQIFLRVHFSVPSPAQVVFPSN